MKVCKPDPNPIELRTPKTNQKETNNNTLSWYYISVSIFLLLVKCNKK